MIDIVTVCAGKDLENITTCIESLQKNLNVNNIYIITNDISQVPKLNQVIAIDENEIITSEKLDELKKIHFPYFTSRFGWYLQQFLKMEFSRSPYCQGDYLIWDADTILLKKINFHDGEKIIFTKGKEKLNKYYVSTYTKLLGIPEGESFSLISQHLYIDNNIMKNMLYEIESKFSCYFGSAILNNIEGNSPSLFSEYETYANYYIYKKNSYEIIDREWFRHAAAICKFGSSLKTIAEKFPNCDYVAMEKFDRTPKGKIKGIIKYYNYKMKNIFKSLSQ
ncbi:MULTISPECIES: DUF6492 family protein [Enterobacterales]|uniref:DUF6492 family protein n=1 Tax=Enterobacterales TaxID=91347 RepID=UPI001EF8DC93|nr:DUF6492 family protein [Citrobacter portucalensis]ULK51946.1 hypothetical protein HUZ88_02260 [Citrobacter portucalensis]